MRKIKNIKITKQLSGAIVSAIFLSIFSSCSFTDNGNNISAEPSVCSSNYNTTTLEETTDPDSVAAAKAKSDEIEPLLYVSAKGQGVESFSYEIYNMVTDGHRQADSAVSGVPFSEIATLIEQQLSSNISHVAVLFQGIISDGEKEEIETALKEKGWTVFSDEGYSRNFGWYTGQRVYLGSEPVTENQFGVPDDKYEETLKNWQTQLDCGAISVEAEPDSDDYIAIGNEWAEAWVNQYLNLSQDHPCYSNKGNVTEVTLQSVSITDHPRSLVFSVTIALRPANGKWGMLAYYDGSCSGEDGEYWLLTREVILVNTKAKKWACTEMSTGGSGNWGYYGVNSDTDISEDIYGIIQNTENSYDLQKSVLMRLYGLSWRNYIESYGYEAASILMDYIEQYAFGSDQELRNIYIMDCSYYLTDEIKPRYVALLKKLKEYDQDLYKTCVEECLYPDKIIELER